MTNGKVFQERFLGQSKERRMVYFGDPPWGGKHTFTAKYFNTHVESVYEITKIFHKLYPIVLAGPEGFTYDDAVQKKKAPSIP